MYLLFLKFSSLQVLFQQHFLKYAVGVFIVAFGLKIAFILCKKQRLLKRMGVLAFLAGGVWYLGPIPALLLFLVITASFLFGSLLIKTTTSVIKFTVGFLVLLHVYVVLGMTESPSSAFTILLTACVVSLSIFTMKTLRHSAQIGDVLDSIYSVVSSFSLLELFLLLAAFVYGSFPQSGLSWDSVYANLYNARWYIELNSFKPLEESISSLFPQHAILYYAMFYTIGGFRSLQAAYLLPLLILLFTLKAWVKHLGIPAWYRMLMHLLVLVGIVLAQSTSGYYDLFMTSLLALGTFSLLYAKDLSFGKRVSVAALCVGVAAASKFFALVLAPFICMAVLVHFLQQKITRTSLVQHTVLALIVSTLMIAPLAVWMGRSYFYTGSPIFPFFQNLFPTEEFWSGGSVEQNPMTQTAISATTWLKGGILLYPVLTYFRTEFYVEGTRGYPGFIYLVLLPAQIILLLLSFRNIVLKKAKVGDWAFLCLFGAFFAVGIFARYYRYLWPYQFLFGLMTFAHGWQYVKRIKIPTVIILIALVFLYAVQTVDLAESFRYVPTPQPSQLFYPEALTQEKSTTLFGQMNALEAGKPVLDASQYMLPRVYFSKRTYMCNWYWINGSNKAKNLLLSEQFSYVIVSKDPLYTGNYCTEFIKASKNLQQVAKDEYRVVYKVE